jgi:hypothetical protein
MMYSPFDNLLHGQRRAGAAWLAFAALLGNILLPAALSIFVLTELRGDTPLCGQSRGDAPGKAKPGWSCSIAHYAPCPLRRCRGRRASWFPARLPIKHRCSY